MATTWTAKLRLLMVGSAALAACSGGGGGEGVDQDKDPASSNEDRNHVGNGPGGAVGSGAEMSSGGGSVAESSSALLGNTDSRHVWARFCDGKADDAKLPLDPRTLVQPGVNEGRAVVFNAYWRDCGNRTAMPASCGEYRAAVDKGYLIGQGQGQVGTAHMFAGTASSSLFTISAEHYNDMWKGWGLDERPKEFDRLVAERHGSAQTPFRNPYPLPGEDPNETDGGSGQLPLVYTQLREADGTYTGRIAVKFCNFCHNGALDMDGSGPDVGAEFGGAGAIGDFQVAFRDFGLSGALQYSAFGLANIATSRGTGAIDQFQLGFLLFMNGDVSSLPIEELISSGAIGTIKSPPWWNLDSRPQKFHGAILPTDAARMDMAAYYPLLGSLLGGKGAEKSVAWVDENDIPFQVWAESLPAPRFPGPVDTKLAEQGAILFHTKNLWADKLDNPVAEPEGGNGSCASCHGVYSDRFANDTAFLETPELKGIAGRTVPMTIVGTDPVYTASMQSLKREDGSFDQDILKNPLLYCGLGAPAEIWEPLMLAPPLWGIWASAPYFHNGSVPNIQGVLDPTQERPRMWKRVSTPKPAGLEVVMGYDTDVQRAYDFVKLGWKYDEVACGDPGTAPGKDCNADDPEAVPPRAAWDPLYESFWFLWNLPLESQPPMNDEDVENRKVYNTWRYSQSNAGHAFSGVLTAAEQKAILEYLKTL